MMGRTNMMSVQKHKDKDTFVSFHVALNVVSVVEANIRKLFCQ